MDEFGNSLHDLRPDTLARPVQPRKAGADIKAWAESLMRRGSRTAMIERFDGEYAFLSNFWPSPLVRDGITYPTVEHAFQAAKAVDRLERQRIAALPTPGAAKRAGRKVAIRPDWETVKVAMMEDLVRRKFADPGL